MKTGTTYYYTQAGIERGARRATEAEAEKDVDNVMQRHNPRVTIRSAVAGKRGSKLVAEYFARCVAK